MPNELNLQFFWLNIFHFQNFHTYNTFALLIKLDQDQQLSKLKLFQNYINFKTIFPTAITMLY